MSSWDGVLASAGARKLWRRDEPPSSQERQNLLGYGKNFLAPLAFWRFILFSDIHVRPSDFLGKWLQIGLLLGAVACAAQRPEPKQRALIFVDKGNHAAAIRVLSDHLQIHPHAIAERRLLIRVLALSGQLGKAEEQAQILAKELGPASPVPWIELGHALEFAHRYDEALEMYDRASEVAPRDPEGPRTAGLRAAHWGEAEIAEPRLIEALRRRSSDAVVWHALGLVRLKLRNFSGAEQAYRSGLQADPQALENRIGLATVAVMQRDARRALAEYDRILAARPSFADAYLGRAWALMTLGRFTEAEQALKVARSRGASARVIAEQERLLGILRGSQDRAEPN